MQCAWNGEEINGKGYVLNTTEGPEVVSERAFKETRSTTDKTARKAADDLMAALAELTARMDAVEHQLGSQKGSTKS